MKFESVTPHQLVFNGILIYDFFTDARGNPINFPVVGGYKVRTNLTPEEVSNLDVARRPSFAQQTGEKVTERMLKELDLSYFRAKAPGLTNDLP